MEDVGLARQALEDRTAQLLDLDMALDAPCGQLRATNEPLENKTDRRLEEDEQQPALRGFRRAPERNDDKHGQTHRPFGGEEHVEPQLVVGEKGGHATDRRAGNESEKSRPGTYITSGVDSTTACASA